MSALSGITMNSAWNFVKKLPNEYGHFVFGSHNDRFADNLTAAVKKDGYKDIFQKVKTAYSDATKTRPDSLLKATQENLSGLWDDLGKAVGGQTTGLWNKTKGVFKALGSKMPLIGNMMMLGFEIPNIVRAFTDGSVGEGVAETAKTTVKLGGWAAGAALGQAIIPIPFLGGVIGFVASDFLMSTAIGKSFTEKQEEKAEKGGNTADGKYTEAQQQAILKNEIAKLQAVKQESGVNSTQPQQQPGSKGVNKYGIPYADYFVEGDYANNYKPNDKAYNLNSSNMFDFVS